VAMPGGKTRGDRREAVAPDAGAAPSPGERLDAFLRVLGQAEAGIRLHDAAGGLAHLRTLWEQHLEETEIRRFPPLLAEGPAANGLVGFFLAEHADLSARLASLERGAGTAGWAQEATQLICRLIQHVFLEARSLPSPGGGEAGAGLDVMGGTTETPSRPVGRATSRGHRPTRGGEP